MRSDSHGPRAPTMTSVTSMPRRDGHGRPHDYDNDANQDATVTAARASMTSTYLTCLAGRDSCGQPDNDYNYDK